MNSDNFKIVIPEVNTESGLHLCSGNVKLYVQSLRLFTANIPATLNKMRTFLQQENVPVPPAQLLAVPPPSPRTEGSKRGTDTEVEDRGSPLKSMKDYSRSAHSLKGMCEYIGADEARKFAKQLEYMADAGDIKGIREYNETFLKQIELIIRNIQTWFDNNSNYLDTMMAP